MPEELHLLSKSKMGKVAVRGGRYFLGTLQRRKGVAEGIRGVWLADSSCNHRPGCSGNFSKVGARYCHSGEGDLGKMTSSKPMVGSWTHPIETLHGDGTRRQRMLLTFLQIETDCRADKTGKNRESRVEDMFETSHDFGVIDSENGK